MHPTVSEMPPVWECCDFSHDFCWPLFVNITMLQVVWLHSLSACWNSDLHTKRAKQPPSSKKNGAKSRFGERKEKDTNWPPTSGEKLSDIPRDSQEPRALLINFFCIKHDTGSPFSFVSLMCIFSFRNFLFLINLKGKSSSFWHQIRKRAHFEWSETPMITS